MKRRGRFRTKLTIGKRAYYAIRDRVGKFLDIESIQKSMIADRRKRSKKIVRSGYGFRGDTKRRP